MAKKAPDLQLVAKLLANVRFRDQSLKLVQYTLKLLQPFVLNRFDANGDDLLLHTQQMVSNGRKAFRLFKSINNLSRLYTVGCTEPSTVEEHVIKVLTMAEDCFWVRPPLSLSVLMLASPLCLSVALLRVRPPAVLPALQAVHR